MSYCKKCGNALPEGAMFCPVCGTAVAEEQASAMPSAPAGTVPVEPRFELAFWWERIVAWFIDVAIIWVILFFLGLVSWFTFQPTLAGWPAWIPFFNVSSIAYFLYWMLMEGAHGQSFGKMIMRIKVTQLDGSQVNMANAAVESVGKAFFLPLDLLIGWLLYPRRRQRIFNYLSNTIVIKVT